MRAVFCILLVLAAKGMILKSLKSSVRDTRNRKAIERMFDRDPRTAPPRRHSNTTNRARPSAGSAARNRTIQRWRAR